MADPLDTLTKASEPKNPTDERSARAVIGPLIQIKGERYGEEDVLIEGGGGHDRSQEQQLDNRAKSLG